MSASRTEFRSFLADVDMSAVAAEPAVGTDFFKDFSALDIGEQLEITLFVVFFDLSHAAEFTGKDVMVDIVVNKILKNQKSIEKVMSLTIYAVVYIL